VNGPGKKGQPPEGIEMDVDAIQDEIVREFSQLGDWFEKYEHLIDLGRKHQPLGEESRTDENALAGCQSRVWIQSELKDGKVRFAAASDSVITSGMIALLFRVLNDQSPDTVSNADLFFVNTIGLADGLSPARANGLETIIRHLRNAAQKLKHS
jgi:cysteine desulfuration protein SufE